MSLHLPPICPSLLFSKFMDSFSSVVATGIITVKDHMFKLLIEFIRIPLDMEKFTFVLCEYWFPNSVLEGLVTFFSLRS